MAKNAPRVGKRLEHKAAQPAVGKRSSYPEQTIAGHFPGKWDYPAVQERHWDITAQEALSAMQEYNGRLRVAILGAHTGQRFKSNPGDGKTLEYREAILQRGSRQEKELEQIVKDVAQYRDDRRAHYARIGRSGLLTRSGAGFAREDVKRYEQARMVEWATKASGLDYVRVHTIAFSPAPVPSVASRRR
jgi:hypothetical protein